MVSTWPASTRASPASRRSSSTQAAADRCNPWVSGGRTRIGTASVATLPARSVAASSRVPAGGAAEVTATGALAPGGEPDGLTALPLERDLVVDGDPGRRRDAEHRRGVVHPEGHRPGGGP